MYKVILLLFLLKTSLQFTFAFETHLIYYKDKDQSFLEILPENFKKSGLELDAFGVDRSTLRLNNSINNNWKASQYSMLEAGTKEQSKILIHLSDESKFHTSKLNFTNNYQSRVDMGGLYKNKKQVYWDNNNTLNSNDDVLSGIRDRKSFLYTNTEVFNREWAANLKFDNQENNQIAGKTIIGDRNQNQVSLGVKNRIAKKQYATFYSIYSDDKFIAFIPQHWDNKNRQVKSGFNLLFDNLNGGFSQENFKRGTESIETKYQRDKIYLSFKSDNELIKDTNLLSEFEIEAAEDQSSKIKTAPMLSNQVKIGLGYKLNKNISTSLGYQIYKLLPSSEYLFGDGGIIRENFSLPQENGYQTSIGLNSNFKYFESKTKFSIGQSKNQPILVATSPSSAKALPIGGVWKQSFDLFLKLKGDWASFYSNINYNNSLNNSQVSWQKGKKIPGVIERLYEVGVEFGNERLKGNLSYNYNGQSYLDLSNNLNLPDSTFINVGLNFLSKNYAIKLAAENLFKKLDNEVHFEGTAGINVLNPFVQGPLYSIAWETTI